MAGVCRLGDRAKAPIDTHGFVCCPHPNVVGPAISASSNVNINGMPALRVDDIGMHMSCCGTNMWKVTSGSGQVFINGARMVRKGDPTQHCGGFGRMIDASGNVIDNSPIIGLSPYSLSPMLPLPLNQVLVFPDMEPFYDQKAPPGLPASGGPQVYDQGQAEQRAAQAAQQTAIAELFSGPPICKPTEIMQQEKMSHIPHLSPGPTAGELRHQGKVADFFGRDDIAQKDFDAADKIDATPIGERISNSARPLIKAGGVAAGAFAEETQKNAEIEAEPRTTHSPVPPGFYQDLYGDGEGREGEGD